MPTDPIHFKRENGTVTLTMSVDNYDRMMILLGWVAGAARQLEKLPTFWKVIRFCNDLNAGNPQYTPYEIPEEHTE